MSTHLLIAFGAAVGAAISSLAAIVFCVLAIRRERRLRQEQVVEAVWEWASVDATRAKVQALGGRLAEILDRVTSCEAQLSQVSDRLTSLEAEKESRRAEPHSAVEEIFRRWERRRDSA